MAAGVAAVPYLKKKTYGSSIKNNNQVILFLNRRGYSSFVSCRECGYVKLQ